MKKVILMVVAFVVMLSLALPGYALGDDFPGANWATYFTYVYECPSGGPVTHQLIAGQHYDVGEVRVWNDEDNLYVEYLIDVPDLYLLEVHIAVAGSLVGIPQKNGNPIPGKFGTKATYDLADMVTNPDPFVIPLDDFDCGDTLYIATHAALSNGETAWSGEEEEPPVWPTIMSVGFEDLPIGAGNDWDYNDWITDFTMVPTYNGDDELTQLEFIFLPQAKGAQYNHDQHLLFPGNTFDFGGTYSVYHDAIEVDSGSFDSANDLDLKIFENTAIVLPANSGVFSNTVDGSGTQPPAYTTDVVIEFTTSFAFTLPDVGDLGPHGEGLFFDPYLYVHNTGQYIHTGDGRTLLVPEDWKWPQEHAPIWTVYGGITSGSPPTFDNPLWYNNVINSSLLWTP